MKNVNGAGEMVSGKLHHKRSRLSGKRFELLEQNSAQNDSGDTDEISACRHKAAAAEERAREQADDRHLCSARNEAGGHNRHFAIAVILDCAGSHDARHTAAGADEHGDEAFSGKAELAENTVHNEGNARHVADILQQGQHQEKHKHLRHKADDRTHTANDTVNNQTIEPRSDLHPFQP